MSVTFRIKASEAQGRRLDPGYHHALRRTRIRSTYPSAKLLTLPYSRLRNWFSTDLYEREGKAQTNFAHRVRISSSMCEIPGLPDHTVLLEVGDMSFKSPKKASELKVNCAGLKAA